MPIQKKITPYQVKTGLIVSVMAAMLIAYFLLLILWLFNVTGSATSIYGALRLGLLMGVAATGATWFYLRPGKNTTVVKTATASPNAQADLKRDLETWFSTIAETIKTKPLTQALPVPPGGEGSRNFLKFSNSLKLVFAEMEKLKQTNQQALGTVRQKEEHIKKLESVIQAREADLVTAKAAADKSLLETEEQKRAQLRLREDFAAQLAAAEKMKTEAANKVERYRNISKFLEQAKSSFYAQQGPGKEWLVQIKMGLLADDAINLSNKNDYHSLNYEIFRNGRSFDQVLKEQPPVHIDAYPESVRKLRQWIRASGLEKEDWNFFYQNYPIPERLTV